MVSSDTINFDMVNYNTAPNLQSIFWDQAKRLGNRPFVWRKLDGVWAALSWREVGEQINALARGLKSYGINFGDRVMLLSENRPEWLIADFAIISIGAITVPAYTSNSVSDNLHILSDSGAKLAIVSSDALAQKLIPAAVKLNLAQVIAMQTPTNIPLGSIKLTSWEEALDMGRTQPDNILSEIENIGRRDTCCIIYTSGTSGIPVGVELSHGGIISNARSGERVLAELPDYQANQEVFLSFLPLSHAYEHLNQFGTVLMGGQIYYAESIAKLMKNIAEVKPTLMFAVPRLLDTIRDQVLLGAKKAGGYKEKLLHKTIKLGAKAHENPSSLTLLDKLINKALNTLVREKVLDRFGGRLKAIIVGGAALNPEVGVFCQALGFSVYQGYGQTESSPTISVSRVNLNKLHSVGLPMEHLDVVIAEDGEILVRGESVMKGYWNQPEKTSQTIIDDWLHTGDIGQFDQDGLLQITGRKKDIIVNPGGDNISPERVEGILCLAPEISQAMVASDEKRFFLVALIVPDPVFVNQWKRENGKKEVSDLDNDPDFRQIIGNIVKQTNKENLSSIERVTKFAILGDPFTIDNEMLTPTQKIRRHIIRKRYGDIFDELYGK